jgi:hypothetical protein
MRAMVIIVNLGSKYEIQPISCSSVDSNSICRKQMSDHHERRIQDDYHMNSL